MPHRCQENECESQIISNETSSLQIQPYSGLFCTKPRPNTKKKNTNLIN